MGTKSRRHEKESRFGRCEICNAEIPIEFYFAKGEVIFCSECSSEYVIQSLKPIVLTLVTEDFEKEDVEKEMSFDD